MTRNNFIRGHKLEDEQYKETTTALHVTLLHDYTYITWRNIESLTIKLKYQTRIKLNEKKGMCTGENDHKN